MPAPCDIEYKERGQVSARTDAFAVGILAIELLTSFDPYAAREIADESSQDELAFVVRQHHDKDPDAVPLSANSREMAEGILPVLPCEWPARELEGFGDVAARCVCHQAKHRATVADVLPALEELVANAESRGARGVEELEAPQLVIDDGDDDIDDDDNQDDEPVLGDDPAFSAMYERSKRRSRDRRRREHS